MTKSQPLFKKHQLKYLLFLSFIVLSVSSTNAQFREVYKGPQGSNAIKGVFFLSPSAGFAAFDNSVGFTQDSGRTFTQRPITINNVDYNGYAVNLTFGFTSQGVHAFTQDSILVYGDYGAEPSILFSANGGLNWKLVFKQDFFDVTSSMFDLKFSANSGSGTGFAISDNFIFQSNDRGQHWQPAVQLSAAANSRFRRLSVFNNYAYAIAGDILYASNNTGTSWNLIGLPPNPANGVVFSKIYFLSGLEGYVTKDDDHTIYKTTNGGTTWTQMNDPSISLVAANDIYFTNSSTGFYTSSLSYDVYKTINSGATWEPCKRGSNYQAGLYGLSRLRFLNGQQGWANANGSPYLLMTTNAGGTTLPKAFFKIDTSSIIINGQVNLINYSNPAYSFKWLKNNTLISTSYNASYTHEIYNPQDSITLIVTNAEGISDTLVKSQYFNLPPNAPQITDFTPVLGGNGSVVTITGVNLNGASAVSFGGTPAASFVINSSTSITARVGLGASGKVSVTTPVATAFKNGFTFTQLPGIISFTPASAGAGVTVNITGYNFGNVTAVSFGGTPAASFIINSSSSITATVAAGATGNIAVTNPNGTATAEGFTWLPAPMIASISPLFGTPGSTVTLTGSNFNNVSKLSVGGIDISPSDYQIVSSTSIVITLPAFAESGDIVVTTAGGSFSWPNFSFYKKPDATSITPAIATTGMTVVITGSNFTGISSVSIGGTPVSSFTVTSPTTISAVVGAGTSGSVLVTNPAGDNGLYRLFFTFTSSPVITAISPSIAAAGSNVTILGGGFNANAARNVVYIGGVKATVIAASANAVTVKMVNGNSLNGVSVTNLDTRLTGYSDKALSVIFPSEATAFNANSFGSQVNIPATNDIAQTKIADIDGDGKPDIVVAYKNASVVSIFRNTSTTLQLSFAARVDVPVNAGVKNVVLADLNNDGKLDILGSRNEMTSNLLTVIQNNSAPGAFSFGTYFTQVFYPGFNLMATGDFNGDGKLDVVGGSSEVSQVSNTNPSLNIWVMENASSNGVISFGSSAEFSTGALPENALISNIVVKDMNLDNKPDIVLGTNAKVIPIFKNAGVATTSFQSFNITSVNSSFFPVFYAHVADFDNDGLPDILTLNRMNKNLGNFTFSSFDISAWMMGNVADLNGDGKVDYVTNIAAGDSMIYVGKNISNSNGIAFAPQVGYLITADQFTASQSADMDGDGRPEIVYINNLLSAVSILKNKLGSAVLCPGGGTVLNSSISSGNSFQWQVNTGGGFVNISDNANYSGTKTSKLQLFAIPYAWSNYQYRCVVDGVNSDAFALQFLNSWTGAVNTAWENAGNWSCGTVPDANTDVILNSGTVLLSSNVTIGSLKLNPGVQFTVSPGFSLTIRH